MVVDDVLHCFLHVELIFTIFIATDVHVLGKNVIIDDGALSWVMDAFDLLANDVLSEVNVAVLHFKLGIERPLLLLSFVDQVGQL